MTRHWEESYELSFDLNINPSTVISGKMNNEHSQKAVRSTWMDLFGNEKVDKIHMDLQKNDMRGG